MTLRIAVPERGVVAAAARSLLEATGFGTSPASLLAAPDLLAPPVKVFALPERDIPIYAAEGELHLALAGSLTLDEASVSVPVALDLDVGRHELALFTSDDEDPRRGRPQRRVRRDPAAQPGAPPPRHLRHRGAPGHPPRPGRARRGHRHRRRRGRRHRPPGRADRAAPDDAPPGWGPDRVTSWSSTGGPPATRRRGSSRRSCSRGCGRRARRAGRTCCSTTARTGLVEHTAELAGRPVAPEVSTLSPGWSTVRVLVGRDRTEVLVERLLDLGCRELITFVPRDHRIGRPEHGVRAIRARGGRADRRRSGAGAPARAARAGARDGVPRPVGDEALSARRPRRPPGGVNVRR